MAASNSSFIPAPLAHADNLGEGHPRGAPLQVTRLVTLSPLGTDFVTNSMKNYSGKGAFEKSPRSTLLEVSKRLYKRPLRRCSPEVRQPLAVACQTNLQI
ncbi:hypothetical protein TNCV_3512501 [Trichonephila clavipes]|nr:hypothetical protein TNCV_3512501 [Trichonephila clavipes]